MSLINIKQKISTLKDIIKKNKYKAKVKAKLVEENGSYYLQDKHTKLKVNVNKAILPQLNKVRIFSLLKEKEGYEIIGFSKILTLPKQKKEVKFLVETKVYNEMKDLFEKSMVMIHNVASKKGIIMIRYNNDADGIAGAYALKEAIFKEYNIKPLLIPNKSPFYHYKDAIKDVNLVKKMNKSKKPVLFIFVDMGSAGEKISYLKLLEENLRVLVIDHHPLSTELPERVMILNPSKYSKEEITAGAVAAELSYIIAGLRVTCGLLAAISFYGDKIDNEVLADYLEKIKDKYNSEDVKKISKVVDVEAFLGSSSLTPLLYKKDITLKKYEEIKRKESAFLTRFEKLKEVYNGNVKIYIVELEDILFLTDWPSAGKATGIINEYLKEKGESNYVILGLTNNTAILRINAEGVKLQDILNEVMDEFDGYAIEGGGHEKAGSIKFPSSIKEKVKEKIIKILS